RRPPPRAQVRCTCGRESRSWWPPELVRMLCIGRIGLQVGSSGLTKTLPGRLRPSPEAAKTTGRSDVIDSSSTHHTAPGFDPGIVAAIHCLSCTVLVTKTWMVGKNRQRRRKNDSKINGTRRYDRSPPESSEIRSVAVQLRAVRRHEPRGRRCCGRPRGNCCPGANAGNETGWRIGPGAGVRLTRLLDGG